MTNNNTTTPSNPRKERPYRRKTHCIHGHEYTQENSYFTKRGDRNCKSCSKISSARRVRKGIRQYHEYTVWLGIKARCFREGHASYRYYGGRGITICDRWKDSYENFLSDMGQRPSILHSIDRIDSDGNYEPSNCRWATSTAQARNKRLSRKNTSGVTGVHWISGYGYWRAAIRINGKTIALGNYKTIADAIKARKDAEIRYDYFNPEAAQTNGEGNG